MNTIHLDPTTLPERLSQGEADAWVLLTSLRPLHAHEDETVRELAFEACANLIALLRALRQAQERLGDGE